MAAAEKDEGMMTRTILIPLLLMAAAWAHAEPRQQEVRYEEMLPSEVMEAIVKRPVAYVPYGSLRWHGSHLPYGVDAIKAHALCVQAARKSGGVVLPATYWSPPGPAKFGSYRGAPAGATEEVFVSVFRWLVSMGFKVVIGVAGYDAPEALAPLQKAAKAVTEEGSAYGIATYEFLTEEPPSDRAAEYETSLMLALKPDLVSMRLLKTEDSGRVSRNHASREAGMKEAARIAEGLGKLAEERLLRIAPKPVE